MQDYLQKYSNMTISDKLFSLLASEVEEMANLGEVILREELKKNVSQVVYLKKDIHCRELQFWSLCPIELKYRAIKNSVREINKL